MVTVLPSSHCSVLTTFPSPQRGSAVGTVSSFFDASQGLGAVMLSGIAAFAGFRGAFIGGAVLLWRRAELPFAGHPTIGTAHAVLYLPDQIVRYRADHAAR